MQYSFHFGSDKSYVVSLQSQKVFPPSVMPISPRFSLDEQKNLQAHPVFCLLCWTHLITEFGWILVIAPGINFPYQLPHSGLNQGSSTLVIEVLYYFRILFSKYILFFHIYYKIYIIIKTQNW